MTLMTRKGLDLTPPSYCYLQPREVRKKKQNFLLSVLSALHRVTLTDALHVTFTVKFGTAFQLPYRTFCQVFRKYLGTFCTVFHLHHRTFCQVFRPHCTGSFSSCPVRDIYSKVWNSLHSVLTTLHCIGS